MGEGKAQAALRRVIHDIAGDLASDSFGESFEHFAWTDFIEMINAIAQQPLDTLLPQDGVDDLSAQDGSNVVGVGVEFCVDV